MITLKEQVENLSKSAAPKTETTTITKEEITKPFKKSILSNESKGWVIYFFRLVNQIETLKQFEIFKDDLRKAIIEQKKNGFRRMTKIKKRMNHI
jgi:hypothetical protein